MEVESVAADVPQTLWAEGVERGLRMVAFLEGQMDLRSTRVLDLGCGYGGIALALAQRVKSVTAADHDVARLAAVRRRAAESGQANLTVCELDSRQEWPFEVGAFDLVVLNGVLEYLGVNDSGANPEERQRTALAACRRALRPGGRLYVGIENRYYPPYVGKDLHCGLPLVAALPRSLSNWVSKRLSGEPFQHYLYSRWHLERLIGEAGFADVRIFVPLFNYQYPIVVMPINDEAKVEEWLARARAVPLSERYVQMTYGRSPRAKEMLFTLLGRTRLFSLFAPCFVVIATA